MCVALQILWKACTISLKLLKFCCYIIQCHFHSLNVAFSPLTNPTHTAVAQALWITTKYLCTHHTIANQIVSCCLKAHNEEGHKMVDSQTILLINVFVNESTLKIANIVKPQCLTVEEQDSRSANTTMRYTSSAPCKYVCMYACTYIHMHVRLG